MRRAAAALALAGLAVPAAADPPAERPFPVPDRSLVLKEERAVYVVEGRVKIPAGVEVTLMKEVVLRGRGGNASLEVAGTLRIAGEHERLVIVEGVTVVPAAAFARIEAERCVFRSGASLATEGETAAEGEVLLKSCRFETRAFLELTLAGGSVQATDLRHNGTVRLRGPAAPAAPSRARAILKALDADGLKVEGLASLEVRSSRVRADPFLCADLGTLLFDGNKVESPAAVFRHSRAGGFSQTRILRTDFYSKRIAFSGPAGIDGPGSVPLERCWFEGVTDPKGIGERIADGTDDPLVGVRALVREPQEKPLELGGKVNR